MLNVRCSAFDVRLTLFSRLARALSFVFRRNVVVRLDVLPVALVPPIEDRARDENRRERAGDNADEKSERQVVDHTAAKNIERERGEKRGQAGEDRSREDLL